VNFRLYTKKEDVLQEEAIT